MHSGGKNFEYPARFWLCGALVAAFALRLPRLRFSLDAGWVLEALGSLEILRDTQNSCQQWFEFQFHGGECVTPLGRQRAFVFDGGDELRENSLAMLAQTARAKAFIIATVDEYASRKREVAPGGDV